MIQVDEWKSVAAQARVATNATEKDEVTSKPGTPKATTADGLLREWLKQGAVKGNPFAHQPQKELIEKLKEVDVPGKGPAGALPG